MWINQKMHLSSYIIGIVLMLTTANISAQSHHKMANKKKDNNCHSLSVQCAQTVTSAFAPNGDLWRLWSYQKSMYFEISRDNGNTFSEIKQVAIAPEKISSRNENRPKIAFDQFNGVYLSWATPGVKKYTADVRFSYSIDYGKTFSVPVTVNNDNLTTGHSFNEMMVTAEGEVSIVWLDGRQSYQLRKEGKETNGSALFLATTNIRKNSQPFTNIQLANETCVCCRIAMDFNKDGNLAIFWRHIYGDNIREFALLTLNGQKVPYQISEDHWQINGCPHQGGGLSIDEGNRYHMVWFNQGDKGKGIFYAHSDNAGKKRSTPLSIGKPSQQAAHPDVSQNNGQVDIVWTEFNGKQHQLWHQRSTDNGQTYGKPVQLASATKGADRPFIINHAGVNYVSWQRPKQGHWIQAL